MAEKKAKPPRLVTPLGTLAFPHLTKPDTQYYALGEYKTKLVLDPKDEAVQAFIKALEDHRDAMVAEYKKANPKNKGYAVRQVFTQHLDKEGNDTGMIAINASQKAVVESATKGTLNFSVLIVDAKRNKYDGKPIYGGTKAKLSVDVLCTALPAGKHVGISLKLVAVQVIELVTGNGGVSAESAGFGEEDGYEAPAVDAEGTEGEKGDF